MLITTKALVLRDKKIMEKSKMLVLLSEDMGLIEASLNDTKKFVNRNTGEILTFCFVYLYRTKTGKYIINSIEPIETFFDIRKDLEALSLVFYFCELIIILRPSESNCKDILRIILNSLYFIANKKKNILFLKFIIEFRLMSISGFMPNFVACSKCGVYEDEFMHFDILNSVIYCNNCKNEFKNFQKRVLSKDMVKSIRYVLFCDLEKLFKFNISEQMISELSNISEIYVLTHTDKNFKSLDIYKSMSNNSY